MRVLVAVVFLAVFGLAGPLAAGSFTVSVTGYAKESRLSGGGRSGSLYREAAMGAVASVEADPLWGCDGEAAFDAYKQRVGPLPQVTVTGSGYTNSQGRFLFNATVSWEGEGEMPTASYRNPEGEEITYVSLPVVFKAVAEGYRTTIVKGRLNEGFEARAEFRMDRAVVLKGSVVAAGGGAPLANLPLRLFRVTFQGDTQCKILDAEFSTDEDGLFETTCYESPRSSFLLRAADGEHAFDPMSIATTTFNLPRGAAFDLGVLKVVPGGGVKFRCIDSETGIGVQGLRGSLRYAFDRYVADYPFCSDRLGQVDEVGLPSGKYKLTVNSTKPIDVTVEAGQITDLGDLYDLGSDSGAAGRPSLQLDVIAFGPTGGLDYYQVSAVYLGSAPPPARHADRHADRKDGKLCITSYLTAERTALENLFSGKWEITVSAEGLLPNITTVTLPRDEPLTVLLEQGGAIRYSLPCWNGHWPAEDWTIAVRHGSPAHKEMGGLTERELGVYVSLKQSLPEGAYKNMDAGVLLEVPAGVYLLLNFSSVEWKPFLFMAEDVEVSPDGTTQVQLERRRARLTIHVVDRGEPRPGYGFYLRHQDDKQAAIQLTTDESGDAVFEATAASSIWVLTEAENQWADNAAKTVNGVASAPLPGSQAYGSYPHDAEYTFDIGAPDQAFVRVRLSLPEGHSVKSPHLMRIEAPADAPRFSGSPSAKIGDDYCFVRVPRGTYLFSGRVECGAHSSWYSNEIAVDETVEQEFEIAVDLCQLEVTVDLPAGIDPKNVRARLDFVEPAQQLLQSNLVLTPAPDGTLVFPCLRPAEYRLSVLVYDGRVVVNARFDVFTLESDASLAVAVSGDVGVLAVRIEGEPALGGHQDGAHALVYLLDSEGRRVYTADPTLVGETGTDKFRLPGIPVGAYTVVIAAPGFQPCEAGTVEIEKDKTTSLRAAPKQAAVLTLEIENVACNADTAILWFYEDSAGQPVEMWLPGGTICTALLPRRKGEAMTVELINLTPAVKQVRLRVEGYQDIVVKLNVAAGDAVEKRVSGEKK